MLQQQQREEEPARYAVVSSASQQTTQESAQTTDASNVDTATVEVIPAVAVEIATKIESEAEIEAEVETAQIWLDTIEVQPGQKWDASTVAIAALILAPFVWSVHDFLQYANYDGDIGASLRPTVWWTLLGLSLLAKVNTFRRESRLQRVEPELLAGRRPTLAWIEPLVHALDSRSKRVRAAARGQLPGLLVRLRPRHSALISPQVWQILGRRLQDNAGRDVPLNLATLKLLERMGGEEMLAFVESCANSTPWAPGAWRVSSAARECLAVMDARLQAEGARQTNVEAPVAGVTEPAVVEPRVVNPEMVRLLAELEEQRRGQGQPGMRLGFLLAAYLTVPVAAWKTAESFFAADWLACGLWGATVVTATQLHRFSLFPKHRELMRRLAEFDDVAGVGALAETLEWPDRRVQDMAARALVRLLPKLRASDGRLLSPAQRGCLYRMLSMRHIGRDGALALAILEALQQVGDKAAIPYVERLARSTALTPTQRKVRQAAEECLPYLRISADNQQASQSLLRASAQENVPADALLRPVFTVVSQEPEELLRATAE
jgi:hypothetical protein